MNKVLFIVKGYYEGTNPNAICACRIADEISSMGAEVYFLSIESRDLEVSNPKIVCITADSKHKKTVADFLIYPLDDLETCEKIFCSAISMIDKNCIDTVVAFARPYAAGEALRKIKCERANVTTVLFEIDSASNRYKKPKTLFENFARFKSIIWEKSVYAKTDLIINMNTHKKHYESKHFDTCRQKIKYVGVPCMQKITYPSSELLSTNKGNKFVYFGTFYPKLREPYVMLDTLELVAKKRDITLTVYGIDKNRAFYEKESFKKDYVHVEGSLEHSILLQKLNDYDVLLSIGNKDSDFLPSKTMECICSGKKVIHFYSSKDDPSLFYFEQYANSLVLYEKESIEFNADKIINFLEKPVVPIKYAELEEKFYDTTPTYSAEVIMSACK